MKGVGPCNMRGPGIEERREVHVGHSVMCGGHLFIFTFTLPCLEGGREREGGKGGREGGRECT